MLERMIEKIFGGYEQRFNQPDLQFPRQLRTKKRVGIIGGGLAGLSAAVYLAERNFQIDIYEKNEYLGGKLGSWRHRFDDGYETQVEHGFHAFFRQYYNLRRMLKKIGAYQNLIPIPDYLIKTLQEGNFSFKNISTTPLLNLLSLKKTGIYTIRDILTNPQFSRMMYFLKYKQENTFHKFDHTTFREFADQTHLPPLMRLMFTTFSRAFFAEPHLISLAELIKSFHFYFLSNNAGLLYDVLNDDFELTLWAPLRSYLQHYDTKIFPNQPIDRIDLQNGKYRIREQLYDYIVLATDIVGSKEIINHSEYIQAQYPLFAADIRKQKESQRYAVLRIWIDKDIDPSLPFFIFTDAIKVLDSVTTYHRMEKSSADWVREHGGGIFELHSYAVPDDMSQALEIRDCLFDEFQTYFPELRGCVLKYEYFQLKKDFTAYHTGLHATRSRHISGLPNLFLAADWIKLPTPAMLMEAAATSALLAVNEILNLEHLQQEQVYTVPLKGILA